MINFRQRLQTRDVVLGQMVLELFTPGIGPMLAAAGMEFVIFDMEHGRCDIALIFPPPRFRDCSISAHVASWFHVLKLASKRNISSRN